MLPLPSPSQISLTSTHILTKISICYSENIQDLIKITCIYSVPMHYFVSGNNIFNVFLFFLCYTLANPFLLSSLLVRILFSVALQTHSKWEGSKTELIWSQDYSGELCEQIENPSKKENLPVEIRPPESLNLDCRIVLLQKASAEQDCFDVILYHFYCMENNL